MKMTLNAALEILKTGDENAAWEMGRQDEGLHDFVTKEMWLEDAQQILARRAQYESIDHCAYEAR
jgi:hypothetical protein